MVKVSGFTFVRNAIKFDYPVVESIRSILSIVDEMIVAVGNSEDDTRNLIASIPSPKIKIIDTVWDDTLREGGKVLAIETNKAFDAVSPKSEWAIYLQADEVIHEKYLMPMRVGMEKWEGDKHVEGFLLNYLHFYGSYDYVGDSRRWYRNEVRIIKNDKKIRSYRDAQGFRKNGRPLRVKPLKVAVHHYGWVKPPESLQAKLESFNKLWHDDKWIEANIPKVDSFDYSKIDSLRKYKASHPEVMKDRIARKNWQFDFDPTQKKLSMTTKFLDLIEKKTGWRIGEYKNYKILE